MCWFTAAFIMLIGISVGIDNGLGLVPAMGYNSWYDLMGDLNEQNLKETAQAMVDLGLVKIGYEYFNLDDIWAKGRNADGTIYADSTKFPSKSLKPLADFVHSKGMKFGTYTDRGTKTCGGRPGSQGYETLDAKVYAEWGVDYVKEDSCHASGDHDTAFKQYAAMRDGLNATGRPIYFSLCGWNSWYAPLGQTLGNSWRIGPDDTNWAGVLKNIDINAALSNYSGPGGWNDPCLLLAEDEHGNKRVTEMQSRAQFSMWAVMASPLLISANLRNMSATNIETYRNTEVIAVNQDPLGKQGIRMAGGPLSSGSLPPAIVLPCDGSENQKWEVDKVMSGFISQQGTCLNVDNCGSDLIYFPCVTTGGTCCGKTCYKNEQFHFDTETRQLASLIRSSKECVQVNNVGGMVLAPCSNSLTVSPDQIWDYNNQTKQLKNQGKCLSRQEVAAFNVWGRPLSGGAWALVFLNTGSAVTNVTCTSDCLSQTGLKGKVTVRDLWTHKDIGEVSISSPLTAINLPAKGGFAMYKLTTIL